MIVAKGGDDEIFPGGGFDRACGNDGDDQIREARERAARGGLQRRSRSGGGNDLFSGGDDDDIIEGGSGEDRLRGNSGADRVFGNGGDDDVEGGSATTSRSTATRARTT